MAFSKKQYENFIRTIVVASVAKEFRSASIIKKAIDAAKNDNKIATGGLIRPDVTGSMIPSRDDRWLLPRESVRIDIGSVENNLPSNINVSIEVEFGVDEDYYFTRSDVDGDWESSYMPNTSAIKKWILAKSRRGISFTYKNKQADLSNPTQLNSVSYVISKSIRDNGFKSEYRSDYFKNVDGRVKKVLTKSLQNASTRIMEKYEEDVYNSILEAIDLNIV